MKEENLIINETKTEEYSITRGGNEDWKKCKYLGSMLDTENDINRRKILAINAEKQLKHVLNNRKINLDTKINIHTAFIKSIFLYNSELWTLTSKLEKEIDAFQRKGLRRILNIRWPDKISNKDLYEKTNQTPWSRNIKRRRISWFGHLLRLSPETPARQALQESIRKVKKPPGRPQLTWITQVKKDLSSVDVVVETEVTQITNTNNHFTGLEKVEELAKDRSIWRAITERVMSQDGKRD